MTDIDIVKAAECCLLNEGCCDPECPFSDWMIKKGEFWDCCDCAHTMNPKIRQETVQNSHTNRTTAY